MAEEPQLLRVIGELALVTALKTAKLPNVWTS